MQQQCIWSDPLRDDNDMLGSISSGNFLIGGCGRDSITRSARARSVGAISVPERAGGLEIECQRESGRLPDQQLAGLAPRNTLINRRPYWRANFSKNGGTKGPDVVLQIEFHHSYIK
jgi:hypothetical protein